MSEAESAPAAVDSPATGQRFWMRGLRAYEKCSPAWQSALRVYVGSRLLVSLAAVVGVGGIPARIDNATVQSYFETGGRLFTALLGIWNRSDALWFLRIAKDGYALGGISPSIFPLVPLAIRGVHALTGLGWLASALLITNGCFLLALHFLYRLVELDHGQETASRALWYLALFPGSLFFFAPYSEAPFLCLAVGAFLAARHGRWGLACLAAAGLGATRNVGVLIGLPLAIELVSSWRREGRVRPWQAAWFAIVPAGTGGYMFYWYERLGEPLYFLHQSAAWGRRPAWPWVTVGGGLEQAWQYGLSYPGGVYVLEALGAVLLIALGVLAARRVALSWVVFVWLGLLPVFCNPYTGRMLCSILRYGAILFPVFIVLAKLANTPARDSAVRVTFASMLSLSVALFVTVQWMY